MPYCPSCGAKNKDGARFCESCGTALAAAAAPNLAASQPQSAAEPAAKSLGTAKILVSVALGIYGFTTVLGMAFAGIIGFVTASLAFVVVLTTAFGPLWKGNIATAKTGVLIGAGLAVLYTLIDFAMGAPFAAILNLVAGAALGVAYMQLK